MTEEKYFSIVDKHAKMLENKLGEEVNQYPTNVMPLCYIIKDMYRDSYYFLNEWLSSRGCAEDLFVLMMQYSEPEKLVDAFIDFIADVYSQEEDLSLRLFRAKNLFSAMCNTWCSNNIVSLEYLGICDKEKFQKCIKLIHEKAWEMVERLDKI